jgi:hypothetical protein
MKRIKMTDIKKLRIISDTRGSALLAVFMIIIIMLILAMGVMALSVSNTKQAKIADTFERDYFVAEGGAKQGIEAIQSAVLEQYRSIAAEMAKGVESNNNAASFFSVIDAVKYTPPLPDSSAGGPNSNTLTFTHTADKNDSATHIYTVLSTATDGKTPRNVVGNISVTFVPVSKTIIAFTPLGDEAVLAGGIFNASNNQVNITGTAKFGKLINNSQYHFNYNGDTNPSAATLLSMQDPNLINTRTWWKMKYPGFTLAVKTPTAQLSLPTFTAATNITNASFSAAPYNWVVPSPIYLDLEGQTGTYTISNFQYKCGQIYCTTNLEISNDVLGTASSPVKIYCAGNLKISNAAVEYAQIYCNGNVTINGGAHYKNVTIYCNGAITDSCTDRSNVRYYCNSYSMSGGNFNYNPSTDTGNIVYAENSIHIESTVHGLFYTNGNIDCGGNGIFGQLVAKGNITTTSFFSFTRDSDMMKKLNVDPFVSSSPGDSCITIVQPISSLVFTGAPTFVES